VASAALAVFLGSVIAVLGETLEGSSSLRVEHVMAGEPPIVMDRYAGQCIHNSQTDRHSDPIS
jgi:hypothetical protein